LRHKAYIAWNPQIRERKRKDMEPQIATRQEKFMTLTIESASGTLKDEKYNINEPVRAVKVSAMAKLHIDPATADNYKLVYQGNQLPDDQKIGQVGLPDGATLVLTPTGATVV
jgi:hypothetical protein